MKETPWSRIRRQNSVDKELLEIVGNGEAYGQCSKGDNCSFRHDVNKRAKMTQSNPSPNSLMQHNERKTSRTRSPRGKSPSGRMSRWPCKDHLKGTCTNSFCEKWRPPECLFYKTKSGCRFGEKFSYAHRQLDEQPRKRSKNNDDKSVVAMLKKYELYERTGRPVFALTEERTDQLCVTHQIHDNWVVSFRAWSRRSCCQSCGRAQTCRNQSDVFNSLKLVHVTLKFETKILRSD